VQVHSQLGGMVHRVSQGAGIDTERLDFGHVERIAQLVCDDG
jgi:hypothetical protein